MSARVKRYETRQGLISVAECVDCGWTFPSGDDSDPAPALKAMREHCATNPGHMACVDQSVMVSLTVPVVQEGGEGA